MKETLDRLGALPETMLITVWARARESRRHDALLRDPLAERIVDSIDLDFGHLGDAWKTQIGVVARTRVMDDLVRAFLQTHPEGAVINLGAGLDGRHTRLDNGRCQWWDIDLPDAIELRAHWVPPTIRHRLRGGCLFEEGWMDELAAARPSAVMFVSEGVLMFHEHARVVRLLTTMAQRFPDGQLAFDAIGGLMLHFPGLHDTLPAFNVGFRSAMRFPRDVADIGTVDVYPLLEVHPDRWRWMRTLRHMPYFRRQFVVAHVQFADGRERYRSRPDATRRAN